MYSCEETHYLQLLTVWYTSQILSFHRGHRSSGSIHIFACAALVFYGVLMEISFDRIGPHINLWGAFLSVIAIFSSKRHALENSRCSCFLNVEIMKATYHWKLLSGQRWCPHRSPNFFWAASTECLRTATQSFLLIYLRKGQCCVLQLEMQLHIYALSKTKLVNVTKEAVRGDKLQVQQSHLFIAEVGVIVSFCSACL